MTFPYLKHAPPRYQLTPLLLLNVIEDEKDVCKIDEIINNNQLIILNDIESKTIVNSVEIL